VPRSFRSERAGCVQPHDDQEQVAGLRHDHLRSLRTMTDAPVRRARERLSWLLVGLVGSFLATGVVARYEEILSREVMVAFFMPAIVYLADAIGTQSEAVAVRGFSMNHVPLRRSIVGEIQTVFLIGSILGLLSLPVVLIGFGSQSLAFAVALSIFAAGGVATSIGILLPWALEEAGRDPAFGSGPVATIVQDLLSLLICFLIVQLLGV
jgi:magnesium transporter